MRSFLLHFFIISGSRHYDWADIRGGFLRRVCPIKPSGLFWYVPGCLNASKCILRKRAECELFVLWRMFSCQHSYSCLCKHWRSTFQLLKRTTVYLPYDDRWLNHTFTDGTTLYRIIWKAKNFRCLQSGHSVFVGSELVFRRSYCARNVCSEEIVCCVDRNFFIKISF